jgi:hypothetical protein
LIARFAERDWRAKGQTNGRLPLPSGLREVPRRHG